MPGWLEDTFLADYAPELTAVLVGLGLLLLIAAAFRRRSRSRGREAEMPPAVQRNRIEVLEWSVVDEKRQILLIRRDDVEHLVMIGGPTDLVIERSIGALAAEAEASRPDQPAAPVILPEMATVVAETRKIQPAPAVAAERPAASVEPIADSEPAAPPDDSAAEPPSVKAPAKARPPLAAVPSPAPLPGVGRNAALAMPAAPASGVPAPVEPAAAGKRVAAPTVEPHRAPLVAEVKPSSAGRQGTVRKEPTLAATGAASRWSGQSAQITVNEPANTQDRPGAESARAQAGAAEQRKTPAPAAETWGQNDDIEGEIGRALQLDPFPPLAFPAGASLPDGGQPGAELRTAGTATADPGTTLGDLAERLEEALAREVRSASQGRTRLDLDLDAFTDPDNSVSPAGSLPNQPQAAPPQPEKRRDSQATIDQHDDPPVISLSARRRELGDPLEDEMARLLGELTDSARR